MIRIMRAKTLNRMRDETTILRQERDVARIQAHAWYDEADYHSRVAEQLLADRDQLQAEYSQHKPEKTDPEPA